LSRVLALLRRDLGSGFALAGVEVAAAADAGAARAALVSAMTSGVYGMVIVEEEFLNGMDETARRELEASTMPLVIAVPGAMAWREEEEAPSDDYIARLIRRAVGYQLNIKL
jgi:vacuolar-type H+-ATPase subunit F/Vma7